MPVTLSSQRKRKIRRRANIEAARTYQPAINAAKNETGAARRSYARAASAARGYTNYSTGSITKEIKAARRSGLPGVAASLRGSRSQAQAGLPFLLGDAQTQLTSDLAAARQDITSARVDKLSHAGTKYTDLLNSAYTAKASRVADQRHTAAVVKAAGLPSGFNPVGLTDTQIMAAGKEAAAGGAGGAGGLTPTQARAAKEKSSQAHQELMRFLDAWKRNDAVDVGGGKTQAMQDLYALKSGADWRAAAAVIAKAESINSVDAMKAIRDFLKHKRKKRKKSRAAAVHALGGTGTFTPGSLGNVG